MRVLADITLTALILVTFLIGVVIAWQWSLGAGLAILAGVIYVNHRLDLL